MFFDDHICCSPHWDGNDSQSCLLKYIIATQDKTNKNRILSLKIICE